MARLVDRIDSMHHIKQKQDTFPVCEKKWLKKPDDFNMFAM